MNSDRSHPEQKRRLQKLKTERRSSRIIHGLHSSVYIRRDAYGIPHIEAQNENDAWLGTGYACAQDRMWQLEWYRLRGQGRWSEVVGVPGVDADVFFRKMGLVAASKAEVDAMSGETRAMFEAYAAGVNAFLESGSLLPAEYGLAGIKPEQWEPWHSVLLFKVRHAVMGKWQLKLARTELLQRIGVEKYRMLESLAPEGQNVLVPPGGVTVGVESPPLQSVASLHRLAAPFAQWASAEGESNSWVVHGSRVTTGKPVLCNDSHRPLDVPNVYWQVHVSCNEFSAAGGAFPGFPAFPHFGNTGKVAWGITHGMADNQDLYLEKFQKEDPSLYLTEEGWRKAEKQISVIHVRGGEPVNLQILKTRHGTIIHGDSTDGWGLALTYTATDRPSRWCECLRPMLTAETVQELIESQREWVDPVNNFLCADAGGSIGYLTRGRLPVRSSADGRQFVVPGWTGEHRWTGEVPFEELPKCINPPQGFIATANQRIHNGEEPYIAHEFAPPARAERITELLKGSRVMSPEEVASIQADTLSVRARGWAEILEKLSKEIWLDPQAVKARDLFTGWDGNLLPESREALLYGCFRRELAREVFQPIVGPETWKWMTNGGNPAAEFLLGLWLYNLGDRTGKLGPETPLPDGRKWEELLPRILSAAWRKAVTLSGADEPKNWRWGPHHGTCAQHTLAATYPGRSQELNPPSVAMGGDSDTIQVSSYNLTGGKPGSGTAGVPKTGAPHAGGAPPSNLGAFPVQSLSVYRQVVDLSDADHARWVIPAGSSGRTESPHFADQLKEWHTHHLVPMHVAAEEVEANTTDELELRPAR